MKKRLLSAALALAMVLTLLPFSAMTAFAAAPTTIPTDDASKKGSLSATYHESNDSQVSNGRGWYAAVPWTDNGTNKTAYIKIATGIIYSGKYYANYASLGNNTVNNFTVIGTISDISLNSSVTSLTLDIYGGSSNASATVNGGTLSSITVTDSKCDSEGRTATRGASFTLSSTLPQNKSFSMSLTNVSSSSTLSLGTAAAADTNVTRSVTLTNSTFGTVTLEGVDNSTPAKHASQSITLNATGAQKNEIGNIKVVGNSSQVKLAGVAGTPPTVILTGTNASLQVTGGSNISTVTLQGDSTSDKDVSAAIPSVTVAKGCTVDEIKMGSGTEKCVNANTITINGTVTKGIAVPKSNVTVDGGTVGGSIAVDTGKVDVKNGSTVTDGVRLKKDATFNLSGTNNVVGQLGYATSGVDTSSVTFNVPDEPTNTITGVSQYYTKKNTLKGGTWVNPLNETVLADSGLIYDLQIGASGPHTYYNADQLGDALLKQGGSSNTNNKLYMVGDTSATKGVIFANGTTEWGYLLISGNKQIPKLPSQMNTVSTPKWVQVGGSFTGNAGGFYNTPATMTNDVTLDAGGGAVTGDITKLTGVSVKTTPNSVANDIKAVVTGNVITLTGAVPAGQTNFTLTLETDAIKKSADGKSEVPVTLEVQVNYIPSTKSLTFANQTIVMDGGARIKPDFSGLELSNGTVYTLSGTGLTVRSSQVGVAGGKDNPSGYTYVSGYKFIEVNVTDSRYTSNDILKKQVIDAVKGGSASFEWDDSPVFKTAVNAALATITDSQVENWIKQAKQKAWTDNNRGVSYKDSTSTPTDYDTAKAWLVPYLQVTVSKFDNAGSFTATLTPMWRVEIVPASVPTTTPIKGAGDSGEYIVKTGTNLTGITGELNGTDKSKGVKLTMNTVTAGYAHQDNTYDYKVTSKAITITHGGSNGLGSFVFDSKTPLVTLYGTVTVTDSTMTTSGTESYFSTLQAAVDAADDKQGIVVGSDYKGSCTINMTGKARTIYVQADGKNIVVANASGGLVDNNAKGSLYTIKLNRDNLVTKGNITISSATGGSASVNKNPANYGDTVTITLSASAGYSPSGVSVKTASGATVSVSGSGSSYTFTMPSGSVTVTPSFTKTQVVNPTVSVGGASSGIGTASTNTSGQVAPGTLVTVTTSPGVGQRTMGINVTGATAIRTGANTFQFSVPSGYNNVVVTPKFDVNNGTLYEDVWSTEYYSNPVRWAVERGITNGQSTYRFGTGYNCTREDMVTFLWRAAGSPVMNNVRNPFWDVQAGSYYYNAVLWAVSKGITNGVTANQFGVGQPVTRAQTVTFLYRYNNSPAASTNSGFYDVSSREYYAKAVSWANAKGVTNGTTATTFSPNNYCPREQIVTFMYRDITGNRA